MDELEDNADWKNICFTTMEAEGRVGIHKASLSPPAIYYWLFQGGTFIVVYFVKCSNVL